MPRGIPKSRIVRTPGVPAVNQGDSQETDIDALVNDAPDMGDGGDAVAAGPALAPDLQAFIQAEIAKGIASGMQAMRVAQSAPRGVTPEELPDQADIDPAAIERPVLTKQGYVMPKGYGEPKADLSKNLRS